MTMGEEDQIVEKTVHPLEYPFTMWFVRRASGSRSQETYEKSVKKIGTFGTVEEFWAYYNFLARPHELPTTSDYLLFKEGIKPMWEDDANKLGGKWIVRLKKGLATRYWEDLILAVVGGQFDVGNELCGVVMSIRYQEDIISIWNRSANNREITLQIRDTVKRLLNLPSQQVMEYKCHDASIRDNSSFRNTDVFR